MLQESILAVIWSLKYDPGDTEQLLDNAVDDCQQYMTGKSTKTWHTSGSNAKGVLLMKTFVYMVL